MKNKLIATSVILAVAVSGFAGNVNVTNSAKNPIPTTGVTAVGGTALTENYYSGRITTNTTTVVSTATSYVYTIVINVSAAGSAWVIKIQSKEGTPTIFYTATAALGTFTPIMVDHPVISGSGIDIVTSGTTPGTADIKITYAR